MSNDIRFLGERNYLNRRHFAADARRSLASVLRHRGDRARHCGF